MPRPLRYLPGPCLVEVTCRTVHGRFLLRPSPKLNRRIVGILARAQERFGLKVCGFVYLSNHCHLLLRPENVEQLARFMAYVNSNIAREAGRLNQWQERFWSRRYTAIVVSNEPEAQELRLRYLLEQGVKEGLVASPRHWPGASSTGALISEDRDSELEGEWIDRTARYRDHSRGRSRPVSSYAKTERLQLSPLPCWDQVLSRQQQQERVRALVREIEAGYARLRPLGRRRVLEQHPHTRPTEPVRTPAPRFHAVSKPVRRMLEWCYRVFEAQYRQAALDLAHGRPSAFPPGCFLPGRFLAASAPG